MLLGSISGRPGIMWPFRRAVIRTATRPRIRDVYRRPSHVGRLADDLWDRHGGHGVTSVYWIPLFELLSQRGVDVKLVDPRQLKRVPGSKTDVLDCQWLQRLHTFGLLAAAFRPDDAICVLRGYLRQRAMLVSYAADHIQHMQKALEQMNVKLPEVVTDITGVTGMAIIRAIGNGERHPARLAALRDGRCKQSEATIALALEGTWRDEHLFALRQAVELSMSHAKITDCDRQIQACLEAFEDKSDGTPLPTKPRTSKRPRNTPAFDVRGHLHRLTGVDLTQVDGIDAHAALKVIAEIGLDMRRWPTEKHFASWLALSPGNKISGGKVLNSRTKASANRAAAVLRMAASSLHHSHSALGAFFRRLKGRLGAPKAITATAQKLACLIYNMLKHGTETRSRPGILRTPVPRPRPGQPDAARTGTRVHLVKTPESPAVSV